MSRTDDTYLKQLQARYHKASKSEEAVTMDEYAEITEYHRKHAAAVRSVRRERVQGMMRRPPHAQYGVEETTALATLADLFDNICSMRLRAAMDVELPCLVRTGLFVLSRSSSGGRNSSASTALRST